MYEVIVILTLFTPHVKPMEQRIVVKDCEASKARIEAVWAETAEEGFYGVLTCERHKKEKKK